MSWQNSTPLCRYCPQTAASERKCGRPCAAAVSAGTHTAAVYSARCTWISHMDTVEDGMRNGVLLIWGWWYYCRGIHRGNAAQRSLTLF